MREPVLRLVAGDDGGVDRADRRSDQPVGLDPGLVQRLVDAGLIGSERPAALEDEDDLAELRLQIFASAAETAISPSRRSILPFLRRRLDEDVGKLDYFTRHAAV